MRRGEILGFLGPNGAGKSTIVRMITGLVEPSHGKVLFHGDPIDASLDRFKTSLGYVPEQPGLYGFLTGWEYLEMVATLRGLDRRRFRHKAAAMLEGLTLYHARYGLIGSYSKGMRQRVVLISALLHDSELLVLDEPFSGLDVTSAMVPALEQVDRLCTHPAAPKTAGFGRAAHHFVVRAMLRSETHRLAIAIAIGLGWMAGSALAAAYLLILGLRIAFDLPAGVPANWIFRATLDPQRNETAGVARRTMLAFLVPLVLAPCLAVGWWQSGIAAAAVHTAYVLTLSVCLIEILLAGYRKMPLTYPLPGFKDNFLMLCLIQFLGFVLFTLAGASVERWMGDAPWRFALLPVAMWAAWYWNRRRLADAREAGELEEGLTFENSVVRAVTRFDLSS